MSFRVNFLARVIAGLAWLALLVMFFRLIFYRTSRIGDWNQEEYLFFLGTSFLLNAILDAFFLPNCTNLSELIRTGNLDFVLLRPVDEQFLVSLEKIDWAEIPSMALGTVLLIYSCWQTGTSITPWGVAGYLLFLAVGTAIMYSFMLLMASASVWIVRNRGMYEMWFYVTQFARYPADVYRGNLLGNSLRIVLTYILPILLAVNAPARFGIKDWAPWLLAYSVLVALFLLWASRQFFHFALRSYRSASS